MASAIVTVIVVIFSLVFLATSIKLILDALVQITQNFDEESKVGQFGIIVLWVIAIISLMSMLIVIGA